MRTETMNIGGLVIEEVDIRNLSEEQIVALNNFGNVLRKESVPEDPPTPLELTRANVQNIPKFYALWEWWGLAPDGSIAASGECGYKEGEENQHLMWAGISVRADYRRRGIAKELLRLLVDTAERESRTTMHGGSSERVPSGEAFARLVGCDLAYADHTNRLVLAEVDRELVNGWIADGPRRAAGYSLEWLDGPYPEHMLEELIPVHEIMNTAPRDDLDMDDEVITVEQMREWEKSMKASGTERWSIFVRHDASGKIIGFTEVGWNPAKPKTVGQWGTGVDPAHRGHAIGKWIKAAMLDRILRERTEAEDLRTGNADSNDAMLGINKQLGFKHYIAHQGWQVKVETLRAYLDGAK